MGIEADPSLQQSGLYNGWEVYNSNTSVASATSYGGNLFYIDERIDFERNTTYYWKVVAKVSDGTEITSSVYSFTTGGWNKLPGKPVITSPANNATDVLKSNLIITWKASADVDNDPVSYNIYLGIGSNNMNLEAGPLTNLEYTIPYSLADQQTYYFTVKAVDGYDGTEVASYDAPFSFTVENYLNDAPDSVILRSPANNAVNTTCDVTLRWDKS